MSTLPPDSARPAAQPSGTDHDALPPGTRFGEFEIVRVLGVGGFGIVYLAKDHSLERDVALKEYMPASLAARGQGPQITVRSSAFAETYAIGLRSFVNEARLLARFDHPSLVKVYRFWEDNATAYMVMPFLQGTTLRDTRRAMAHPPNEAWVRSVIAPILSALELLHREGVYHRDIAPDNILLPHDGPPVLLDFGAARRVISDRTQSLTAILKPSYAPIEQYAEMAQMRQGPWTDLYALGAVIHYLLFGAPPSPATARAVQDDAESIESRIVPGVSPRFLEAVSWMLSLRPNQRPQNGEQLRAVLDGHAQIPPRGRPGITIPGALSPAAPATFEPTRVAEAADSGPSLTAARQGQLPTSAAAPVTPAPAAAPPTFRPSAQMPTARPPPARAEAPVTAPPRRTAAPSTTRPPPATRPGPPAAATGPAATQPPATRSAATQPPGSRPVPLATPPQGLAGAPLAAQARRGTSTATWLVVAAGGAVVVVIAAVAGWQLARQQNAATADAAASAPVPQVATAPAPAASNAGVLAPTPALAARPAVAPPVPAQSPARADAPLRTGTTAAPVAASAITRSAASQARAASVAAKDPAVAPAPPNRPLLAGAAAPGLSTSTPMSRPPSRTVPQTSTDPGLAAPAVPLARPAGSGYAGASVTGYGDAPTRPPGAGAGRDAAAPPEVAAVETVTGANSAREACGKRRFIALAVCMDERCEEPRFRQTPECVSVLARKAFRENR